MMALEDARLYQFTVYVVVAGEDEDECQRYLRDVIGTEPDILDVTVGTGREVRPAGASESKG